MDTCCKASLIIFFLTQNQNISHTFTGFDSVRIESITSTDTFTSYAVTQQESFIYIQCDDKGGLLKQTLWLTDTKWASGTRWCLSWWRWCYVGGTSGLSSDHNFIYDHMQPLKSHSCASGVHAHFRTWCRCVCSKARVFAACGLWHMHRDICISM